jgi:hypothetical protein
MGDELKEVVLLLSKAWYSFKYATTTFIIKIIDANH